MQCLARKPVYNYDKATWKLIRQYNVHKIGLQGQALNTKLIINTA